MVFISEGGNAKQKLAEAQERVPVDLKRNTGECRIVRRRNAIDSNP